jgi:S-adenosylmethionine uptake transporter
MVLLINLIQMMNSAVSSWFLKKGYFQGVFWITLVALTSNMNDILMRLAGCRIPAMEITFFRYFFATLTLLPIMLAKGKESFYTTRPLMHLVRSFLLFGAIACWSMAVTMVPLAVVSTMALTVPLFVLPMAFFLLKESVGWQRVFATIAGFLGIAVIVLANKNGDASLMDSFMDGGNGTLYLLIAAVLFALSDIINKKYVSCESDLSMLFYLAFGTMVIGFFPAYQQWVTPSIHEIIYLLCLGAGGNLILYFLLRAFSATDVSALAPYRYTELIFATCFGYLFFKEIPTSTFWIGALIIIASTSLISYYELRKQK